MSVEEFNQPSGQAIEAADFHAPGEQQRSNYQTTSKTGSSRGIIEVHSSASWWHSQFNLMVFVFALLGVATLLFILLTPAPNDGAANTRISAAGAVTKVSVAQDQEQSSAPFDESRREQARADSQDILASLLDTKKLLEEKNVESWGNERYLAAVESAEKGDELYKQKNYAEAIRQYSSALGAFEAIYDLIPNELSRRVSLGIKAINDGKSDLALKQFRSALMLDQNFIPALQGLERVKTLDEVLALVAAAALDEQDFVNSDDLNDIEQAKMKYQQALALDGGAQPAILGLAKASELETDKRYRIAMSNGFNALFSNRYANARQAFNSALALVPNDKTAKNALRQSLASDKRTSLGSLLKGAKRFESSEQWANALSNYQTVLQRDANQVSAKIGRIRSQARLELDQSLKTVLADPLALSRATVKQRAQDILIDARGITSKGPLLSKQINTLEKILTQAESTIKVSFNSDSLTQVSLKKAGAKRINLGRFDIKKLALKPGRYTLIGTRLGYHDTRTELELAPAESSVKSFTVACNQPISDAG